MCMMHEAAVPNYVESESINSGNGSRKLSESSAAERAANETVKYVISNYGETAIIIHDRTTESENQSLRMRPTSKGKRFVPVSAKENVVRSVGGRRKPNWMYSESASGLHYPSRRPLRS